MVVGNVAAAAHAKVAAKRRHEAVQAQMQNDADAAEIIFDELDANKSGALTREQTRDLLTRVTGKPASDDGVQMVLNAIAPAEEAGSAGVAFGGDGSEPMPRDGVLAGIKKFRYYLQRVDRIDGIFARFDTNKSGALEPDQVKQCMQNVEDTLKGSKQREAFGVVMSLKVSDEDVAYILEDCDVSGNGAITKAELLPALAKWEMLAEAHVVAVKKSCACVTS